MNLYLATRWSKLNTLEVISGTSRANLAARRGLEIRWGEQSVFLGGLGGEWRGGRGESLKLPATFQSVSQGGLKYSNYLGMQGSGTGLYSLASAGPS